jgi:ABC-type transport system involved in multi-copper enzyme maturation permease subunit
MSFLSIVERELRSAARRPGTYRTRTIFALVASALAAGLLIIGHAASSSRFGNAVFPALAMLAFLFSLLAGARSAADSISEEKREGTLGLLFLTDLTGFEVVLGKLAACSIRTFHSFFAFIPVLATT